MSNSEFENKETGLDLFEQMSRLQWLMMRSRMMARKQHGPMADPHRGQGRVLKLLQMRPEISQRELTYLLDMRPQSLGELLTKLEKAGYITREPSEEDRRVMNVRLTDAGKQAASDVEPKGSLEDVFDCLSEEEQRALSGYLARVIEALEAQMDEDDESGWGERGPRFGRGGMEERMREFERHFGGRHGFGPDGMRRDGRFVPLMERARCGRDERDCRGEHGEHGQRGDRPERPEPENV